MQHEISIVWSVLYNARVFGYICILLLLHLLNLRTVLTILHLFSVYCNQWDNSSYHIESIMLSHGCITKQTGLATSFLGYYSYLTPEELSYKVLAAARIPPGNVGSP